MRLKILCTLQCLPNLEHVITLQARIHALFIACWEKEKGQKGKRKKEERKENEKKEKEYCGYRLVSIVTGQKKDTH